MTGSPETPPSICETPPPSVCEIPEPGSTLEPGKKAAAPLLVPDQEGVDEKPQAETKQPVTERLPVDRHTCPTCGNHWPASYGPKCYQCDGKPSTAGLAAPEPGKYDCLEDETPAANAAHTERMKPRLQILQVATTVPRSGRLQAEYADRYCEVARADKASRQYQRRRRIVGGVASGTLARLRSLP